MTYRIDTHRPARTEMHAHEQMAAHAATEVGQETKEELATIADVALACTAVALFLAGLGAFLLIVHTLFGVLA
jgi:hypothetical protein